jgi:hypothetical protein
VALPDTSPGVAPEDPVAAAIRDVAQLLDVDVHQVTRVGVFVAADHPPGAAVQMGQAWESIAGQDPMHSGWVQPEEVGDAGGAPPAREADLDDPPLGPGRGASRTSGDSVLTSQSTPNPEALPQTKIIRSRVGAHPTAMGSTPRRSS